MILNMVTGSTEVDEIVEMSSATTYTGTSTTIYTRDRVRLTFQKRGRYYVIFESNNTAYPKNATISAGQDISYIDMSAQHEYTRSDYYKILQVDVFSDGSALDLIGGGPSGMYLRVRTLLTSGQSAPEVYQVT